MSSWGCPEWSINAFVRFRMQDFSSNGTAALLYKDSLTHQSMEKECIDNSKKIRIVQHLLEKGQVQSILTIQSASQAQILTKNLERRPDVKTTNLGECTHCATHVLTRARICPTPTDQESIFIRKIR